MNGAITRNRIVGFLKKESPNVYILYTFGFLIVVIGVVLLFVSSGHSMVWSPDGYEQHYPALFYTSKYLRNIVKGLLGMQPLSLPMVDFSIGQGLDVLTTLNYYGFGDPFNLISVFFGSGELEVLYGVLAFLRLYCAGLAFCAFAKFICSGNPYAVLIGAYIYTFSGFSVNYTTKHPFFICGMLYLPLILLGAERIIQKGKGGVLVWSVFLSMISNFYFAYINTLLAIIYIFIRLITRPNTNLHFILRKGISIIGHYVWGLLLSAIIFLPVLYAFLQNSRITVESGWTHPLFSADYYRYLFSYFAVPLRGAGHTTYLNLLPITPIILIALFLKKDRKYRYLKIIIIFMTLMLCIPFAGKIMNGFAYVCNRWSYGFAFICGIIAVEIIPELVKLTRREKTIIVIIVGIYILITFLDSKTNNVYKFMGMAMIALSLCVVLLLGESGKARYAYVKALVSCCVLFAFIQYTVTFHENFGGYINEYKEIGTAQMDFESTSIRSALNVDDDSFYRIEQASSAYLYNQSLLMGYHGTTSYYSITPGVISDYYAGLALGTYRQPYVLNGWDDRASLNTLDSVKYFTVADGEKAHVPFGFDEFSSSVVCSGDTVYKNQFALPIGYTYAGYMLYEQYIELSPLEKQSALTQCAILDIEPTGQHQIIPETNVQKLEHTIETNNIQQVENELRVQKDSWMVCSFSAPPNSEVYLQIDGLELINSSATTMNLSILSEGISKRIVVRSPIVDYYFDRESYSVNLGYQEGGINYCKIIFPYDAVLNMDNMSIYSLPMESYAAQVTALGEEAMQDIIISTNGFSGRLSLQTEMILQFSIPYSKGWRVFVNGEETELLRTGTQYMALPLPKGDYYIELRYSTPYLLLGAITSLIAVAAVVLNIIVQVIRKQRYVKGTAK